MTEQIPSLTRAAADYVHAFNIAAVCAYRDGHIEVSQNPVGAAQAWWLQADQAGGVVKQARKNGGDIPAAARELGVTLTAHDVVISRAKAATARIENALSEAQRRGDLQFFNAEYKRRRAEAAAAGKGFMSYGQARARLQRAIADVAATGGTVTPALLASVFS
jgi:hypothetical protein